MAKARKVGKATKKKAMEKATKVTPASVETPSVEIVPVTDTPITPAEVVVDEPQLPDPPKPKRKKGKISEGTRNRTPPRPQKTRKSKAKFADDPTEPDRCHAAAKSTGERCGQPSIRGMQVCYLHGGKSTGGPVKHGGYSRVLQKRRAALYDNARANDEMLYDLTETLALSHVVLTRAIERAQEADVPEFRSRARALLGDAFVLGAENKHAAMAAKLQELKRLLDSGVREDRALKHMTEAIDSMATRKKESWDVRLKAAHALNERDLEMIMARVIDICIRTVGAEDAQRIAQELDREGF